MTLLLRELEKGRDGCRKVVLSIISILVVAAALAGCGTTVASGNASLQVVAAENFYGALTRQIAGNSVHVTSILSNPDADPHLFQANTTTGEAVATADVVIQNGVGYDPWMGRLLAAAPSEDRIVVTVARTLHVTGSDPNPHLWYDALRIPKVIQAIASALRQADPKHAVSYRVGARDTIRSLQPLFNEVRRLRSRFAGSPVAYTERVPGLLLSDARLNVLTPPAFARAIEDGTDPSVSDVVAMRNLILQHRIDALLYNRQATTRITQDLRGLAHSHGIPVVGVTETLPAGLTFVDWQLQQARSLKRALDSQTKGRNP